MESAFLVMSFLPCKHAFVIGLPGGNEVIEDAGKLMGDVLDGLWSTMSGALRSVIIAQIGFVVVKRLSGESKGSGGTIIGFWVPASDAAASTEAIFAA